MEKILYSRVTALIANVLPVEEIKTEFAKSSVIADFDVNLRNLAVLLITKHLAVPGGVPEAMDLLRFERVYADTSKVYKWSAEMDENVQNEMLAGLDKESLGVVEELKYRMVVRDWYQALMIAMADDDQFTKTNAENKIREMEDERASHNVTYSQIYVDQYYRGKLRDARIRYPSAVASLLRDNLNRLEDRWLTAVDTARKSNNTEPGSTRTAKFFELETQLHRAYVSEKIFAEELFKTLNYK